MKINWIRHGESLSNVSNNILNQFIHPVLTHNGMIQSKNLSNFLLKDNNKYDLVYCSPTIRTILTALITVTMYNFKKNNKIIEKIIVIPEISEKFYIIDKIKNLIKNNYFIENILNKQNKLIEYEKIQKIINILINWLNNNYISYLFFDKIVKLLENNNDNLVKKNLQIIKINRYDQKIILEKLEEIIQINIKSKIINKLNNIINFRFNENIIDLSEYINYNKNNENNNFYEKIKNNEEKENILCFSHKYYIKSVCKKLNYDNLLNTEIIQQTIKFENNKIVIIKEEKIYQNINKDYIIQNNIKINNELFNETKKLL